MKQVEIAMGGEVVAKPGKLKHHITCPYSRYCHILCAFYHEERQTSDDGKFTQLLAMCKKHVIGELC